jgi:hypothetical protein
MNDFPEFDRAYKTVLIKDKQDRFEKLAADANFNVYHSDIWRGTGRKFAELIVQECASMCGSQADRRLLLKAFGLPVESDVKSPAPEPHGSVTSQYTREYNIPKGVTNKKS